MVEGKVQNSVNVPLSAFAARKAKKVPFQDTFKIVTVNGSGNAGLFRGLEESKEDQPRPPKKRKLEVKQPSHNSPTLSPHEHGNTSAISTSASVETTSLRQRLSGSPRRDGFSVHASAQEYGEVSLGDSDAGIRGESSSGAEVVPRETVPVRKLSSFSPTEGNVLRDTEQEWTIRLEEHDTLAIIGQYDLWVRRGAVTLMGATLHASPKLHRVYAPSTHSLPVIQYARDPYGPMHQPVEITIISCRSQLRLLRSLSWRFARIWNKKLAKTLPSIPAQSSGPRSFISLASSAEDPLKRPLHLIKIRADWQSLITKLVVTELPNPLAVMVCGPKNSGKSTFTRYLANSILMRTTRRFQSQNITQDDGVALLDLDPGQPEFSPPGEISLLHLRSCNLGPSYAHPAVPPGNRVIRAHHFGAISPKEDPDHYLECVLDLVVHYRRMISTYYSCPLVVNCSGWVLGSGLEVLVELIQKISMTAVVYMSTTGPAEVVDTLVEASKESRTPFHALSSQPTEYTNRTAADLRAMQTLSYFHLDEPEGENLRWNAKPLTEMPPLVIKYAGANRVIFGIMVLGEQLDPDCLVTVLDGSVVGVVAIEDNSALELKERAAQSTDYHIEERLGLENSTAIDHFSQDQLVATNEDASNVGSEQESLQVPSLFSFERCERDNVLVSQDSRDVHPNIHRTADGNLPYFIAANGTCTALDPSKSRSLGQALVRYIDKSSQALHLLTPIPLDTLSSLHAKKVKIVLVRGKLDTPTWAYQEDVAKIRKRMEIAEGLELPGWDEGVPWMRKITGRNSKQKGDKVWKVRRNLKAHGSGTDGAVSE